MGCYGQQILQFVVVILEGGHSVPIKEQALCLVANIADGNDARNYIMNNEDVLRKIMNYMLDTRTKLQVCTFVGIKPLPSYTTGFKLDAVR